MKISTKKFYIAPSILSADFSEIKDTLVELKRIGIEIVHFDVMDQHFVPNLTFGHKFIADLRPKSKLFFDTHLMIEQPEKWVERFIKAGCDNLTFHIEATKKPEQVIEKIKNAGISCGISIKPKTKVEDIEKYLDKVDLILVMTVEPGFGGQKLIENTIEKISSLKQIKKEKGYQYIIEADGGIGEDNIKKLKNLGMDIAVMGSSFFKQKDYGKFHDKIKNIVA